MYAFPPFAISAADSAKDADPAVVTAAVESVTFEVGTDADAAFE